MLLLADARELPPRRRREENVAYADEHPLACQRLLEEVARPELDRQRGVFGGRVPADDDNGDVLDRLVRADSRQGVEPAHVRELHVEDREVDRNVRVGEHGQRLRRRFRLDDR